MEEEFSIEFKNDKFGSSIDFEFFIKSKGMDVTLWPADSDYEYTHLTFDQVKQLHTFLTEQLKSIGGL